VPAHRHRDDLTGNGRPPGWASGGWFEGDLVAERFELVDVVLFAPFGSDPVVVEVGAEVAVAAGGGGEQMPDDDEGGPGDGDLGFLLADATGQAAVAGAEEGVGPLKRLLRRARS